MHFQAEFPFCVPYRVIIQRRISVHHFDAYQAAARGRPRLAKRRLQGNHGIQKWQGWVYAGAAQITLSEKGRFLWRRQNALLTGDDALRQVCGQYARRRRAVLSDNDCIGRYRLMNSMVDSLFDQYDRGLMTRHNLVQALAAPCTADVYPGAGRRPGFWCNRSRLVRQPYRLTASDVPRSFAFYERLFGVTKG